MGIETPKEQFQNKTEVLPESEGNVELPDKFQAVIVLGKDWREYPPEIPPPETWKLRQSLESKMSTIAAGEMYKSGVTDKIIFTTGNSPGEKWQPEAETMKQLLQKKYPDIPDEDIIVEGESIDTFENAERVAPILEKHGFQNVALLTVGFHLERAEKIFENMGISVHGFPSEEILKKRSPHYKKFVERFLSSGRVKKERVKELRLLGWQDILQDKNAIVLVEWADRIRRALPKEYIRIQFEFVDEKTRKIIFYD